MVSNRTRTKMSKDLHLEREREREGSWQMRERERERERDKERDKERQNVCQKSVMGQKKSIMTESVIRKALNKVNPRISRDFLMQQI